MKVLALNGSHRKGKNTAAMLRLVLAEVEAAGIETELLEITDLNIRPCLSCNHCLQQPACRITDDDMPRLAEKMLAAQGIVLGSPVYFGNVTGLLKIFMDRTRWMHMTANLLEGKIGAAVTHAGLRNGGQEMTLLILERFLKAQGLLVVDDREPQGGIYNVGAAGSLYAGLEDKTIRWRRNVAEDALAVHSCRQLGRNLARKVRELI
ncbi:MAG: flavodoxin family protein [Bacillota bacterium]